MAARKSVTVYWRGN